MRKNGQPSALHNGRTWKRLIRIERAVALQVSGLFTDAQIAAQIGICSVAYTTIKQTPEFKQRMIAATSGVIAQNDLAIKTDREYQAEYIREMVPTALTRLANLMLSKNEPVALKATMEVLDRDGTHAKVSRTSVEVKDHKDRSATDALSVNILAVIGGKVQQDINQPMDEVMAEFTKGAMDADAQIDSNIEIIGEQALDTIDTGKLTVQ